MKRMERKGVRRVLILAALLGLGLAGASAARVAAHMRLSPPPDEDWRAPDSAMNVKNPVPVTNAGLAAAKPVYSNECARCHGDQGDGAGPDADMYDTPPASFTDARMMNEMTDGEIFWKITNGRKPMPSFEKKLTDEQRWQMVNFLRTFAAKPTPAPASKKPTTAAPAKKPS